MNTNVFTHYVVVFLKMSDSLVVFLKILVLIVFLKMSDSVVVFLKILVLVVFLKMSDIFFSQKH